MASEDKKTKRLGLVIDEPGIEGKQEIGPRSNHYKTYFSVIHKYLGEFGHSDWFDGRSRALS